MKMKMRFSILGTGGGMVQREAGGAQRSLVGKARCAPTVVHSLVVQLFGCASGGKDASEEKEWASMRCVAMARVEPRERLQHQQII